MEEETAELNLTSKSTFESLKGHISDESLQSIEDMGFTTMTEIQAKTLIPLLEGKDLVGAAKTGSGKTLAFLIPSIELLKKKEFTRQMGTGIIILSPTRELSIQTFTVVKELTKHHSLSIGLVMGGTSMQSEFDKLVEGVNILVATPGRLLDHLTNNKNFVYENLQALIIDEADRILDTGFEVQMQQIIRKLPKKRQSLLFSATLSEKTKGLIKFALRKNHISVGLDHEEEVATVEGLVQAYVIIDSETRFLALFTLLKKVEKKMKTMVFFSSCMAVKFFFELFNHIDLPVLAIHGRQKQNRRTQTFERFLKAEKGILLCTDVASRGLDIPMVDLIIQYDPPENPEEYIHRVGRTARQEKKGKAILFLRPEEKAFLNYLEDAKVPVEEETFDQSRLYQVQPKLEKLVMTSYSLHLSAKEAYKSYIRAYDSHQLKEIFAVNSLDKTKVAKSFGFPIAPGVDLGVTEYKLCQKRGRDHYYKNTNQNKKRKLN